MCTCVQSVANGGGAVFVCVCVCVGKELRKWKIGQKIVIYTLMPKLISVLQCMHLLPIGQVLKMASTHGMPHYVH